MIIRLLILTFAAAAAYQLLRGVPQDWPAWLRAGLATALLLPTLAWWLRPSAPALVRARNRRPAGWLDRTALGLGVAAAACGFMWLLSAAPEPLESFSMALEERARPQAAAARREHQQPDRKRPARGNWLWNDEGRRALPLRTSFKPGNRPELFIRLRDRGDAAELLRGQVYARAFTLSRYQDATWSAHPGTPERIRADLAGMVQLATPTRRTILHEVFHPYDPDGQNPLIALQGVVSAQVPEVSRLEEGLLLLPPPEQPSGYEYLASSTPLRLEDLSETLELAPAVLSDPVFTADLPPSPFATRLRELATAAAGTGSTRQRLLKLRDHLRSSLAYSLETSNLDSLDPIENFLFAEQRGHCEYFATAAALLARALGIPSRMAYGWTTGTYYESSNMFVFRAREAHAWTEVCLDGYGWVVLDATPPGGLGRSRTTVAPPGETPPTALTLEDDPEPAAPSPPGRLARWLALGLALPALALLIVRSIGRRRVAVGEPDAPPPALGTPHYLSLWRRAAARRGTAMPAGMTLRQHLARLTLPTPFAADLLAYHYAVRYGGSPPDPRRERALAAAIGRWADERDPPPADSARESPA